MSLASSPARFRRSLINLTLAAAAGAVAAPAQAQSAPPAVAPVRTAPASPPVKSGKKAPPVKVTAAERAEADRMDPLAQVAFWDNVVQSDPRDIVAEVKLAKALRALTRYDEAEAAISQALVVEPKNLEALLESARDHIAAGDGFFAIEPAQRAAELAPRDWRCQSLLAIALEQDQRDDEAVTAHRKALALAPDNPAAITNLGIFEVAHGQTADGEALLRRAADQPSATPQERENLALILGMQGQFDAAEHIERRDLPPSVVDNNLAYLRADAATAAPRTWASVEKGQ